jgi:hypothetical protein
MNRERAMRWLGAGLLVGIVLASLAFRIHVARECSLWLDEVLTHMGVLKAWPRVLRGPSVGHPPLMYVLVKAYTGLFGMTELSLRGVSLLFGCLALLALHELARELGLSVWRALIVVGTFALSGLFIRHASEARHYALLITFVTLATTRAVRLLQGPIKHRDLVTFALSAVAAAASQYFGLAYALALAVAVVVALARRWHQVSTPHKLVSLGVLASAAVPLVALALRVAHLGRSFKVGQPDGEVAKVNGQLFLEILRVFSFLTNDVWALLIQPILALVGLVLLTRRLRGMARLLPLGIGVAPCIAAIFMSSNHFMSARYVAPSVVLYHLGSCLAAFALIDQLRLALARFQRVGRVATLTGAAALVGLVAMRLREYPTSFGTGADDYRGLHKHYLAQLQPDTAFVAFPGYFGKLLFGREYRVGERLIGLEQFKRIKGIKHYLIVEINCDTPERRAELEALVEKHFGLSPERWNALPRLTLPPSEYQPSVPARLVDLPDPPRRPKKHRPRRKHATSEDS